MHRRGQSLQQNIHRMDDEPDQAADQSAVDADILQVTADRILQPPRDRLRVPAAQGGRHQATYRVALIGRGAHRGAAGEAVDRVGELGIFLQRGAKLVHRLSEPAGHH